MSMRILNWNTEFVSPRSRGGRFEKAQALIEAHDPDVICLTEARPELMPEGGETITSQLSGAGNIENRGGRKVLLWSRFGWSDVDTLGAPCLPEGRFVCASTSIDSVTWTVVGMCIPYFGYRINKRFWGDDALRPWQGAETYLDALRNKVLPQDRFRQRTILLGDYNLHIPPGKASRQTKAVSRKCEATFAGWNIATAGEPDDPALDKRFIDHIAVSSDIRPLTIQFFSRFHADSTRLSDHNGVCIDLEIHDPR